MCNNPLSSLPRVITIIFFSTSNLGNIFFTRNFFILAYLLKTNTIMIIPFGEGGLIVCVWETNEGDLRFLYAMNSMPPRSRILGAQSVNVPKTLNASTLHFLCVRRCLRVESRQLKRRRRSLFELTN